eukprot:s3239_g10.t2
MKCTEVVATSFSVAIFPSWLIHIPQERSSLGFRNHETLLRRSVKCHSVECSWGAFGRSGPGRAGCGFAWLISTLTGTAVVLFGSAFPQSLRCLFVNPTCRPYQINTRCWNCKNTQSIRFGFGDWAYHFYLDFDCLISLIMLSSLQALHRVKRAR